MAVFRAGDHPERSGTPDLISSPVIKTNMNIYQTLTYPILTGGGPSIQAPMDDNRPPPPPVEIFNTDSESESDSLFVEEEWIGRGYQWNDSLPSNVKRACTRAGRVPPEILVSFVPSSSSSVSGALAQTIFNDAPSCMAQSPNVPVYSSAPPQNIPFQSSSLDIHLRRLLYAVPHRRTLSDTFNNAWLSGARSLHIQGFLYPLWSVSLLLQLDIFTQRRNRWMGAVLFLDNVEANANGIETLELVEECRATFDVIPFNSAIPTIDDGCTLQTRDLATLLRTGLSGWLTGELIDGGADYIRQRLPPNSRTEIASTLCPALIRQRHTSNPDAVYTYSSAGALAQLESRIHDGSVTTVYFPLHVHGGHWTLLKVDFHSQTLEYADSRAHSANLPSDIKADFLWWLSNILPDHISASSFQTRNPSFAVPDQHDTDSCGVVVVCMLASALLRLPNWSQESCMEERMVWFLRFAEAFGDGSSVRKSSCFLPYLLLQ